MGDTPKSSHPGIPSHSWVFRATLVRVVDADSLRVVCDGGFHNHQQEQLRLIGVNAPEVVGATKAAGLAATAWVREWLAVANAAGLTWPLVIQTYKSDVFGRYLADAWRLVDGAHLNTDLIAAGHAVEDVR